MPRLTVIDGVDEGRQFELVEPVIVIGRDSGCAIRLFDTEVSRRHAELRRRAERPSYSVHDIASANGVVLNGQPVVSAELRAGDQIQLGKTTLVYSGVPGEHLRSESQPTIRIVTRSGDDLPSAILQSIDAKDGSQILAQADDVRSPWLKTRLANLGIMYEAIQAVSHILNIDDLLDRILELLFTSIEADRGCILLRNSPAEPLVVRAVRFREGRGRDEITLSRTIVDYVVRENKGVLVTDAGQDDRFRGGASVVRLGIREAICVPLSGRHETVGILYFDALRPIQSQKSDELPRLNDDHLSLAVAVAHQAAVAVEETRYYDALLQSERLAAVGQAIASVSHHIKNILQGMRSGSDVLKLGITQRDDSSIEAGWRLMEKNQSRIYQLVLDMLSYSKEREPVCESCSPEKIAGEVVELLQGRAAKDGVKLTLVCEPAPAVHLDAEGIHRAVLNLATNALDAVAGREQPEVTIRVTCEPESHWLRITVSDNGVGIEPDRMLDLFKPFQSTKGSRGTGLGLAVSRKIAREHGGDVLVESKPGIGSDFTIRLPIKLS